jgi:hypothetical protein
VGEVQTRTLPGLLWLLPPGCCGLPMLATMVGEQVRTVAVCWVGEWTYTAPPIPVPAG